MADSNSAPVDPRGDGEYEPSPTLSNSPASGTRQALASQPHQRRRSILTRLRKSLLPPSSPQPDAQSPAATPQPQDALHRSLSLDAGLQHRISQLSEDHGQPPAIERPSPVRAGRLRRTRSVVTSLLETIAETGDHAIPVLSSHIASPTELAEEVDTTLFTDTAESTAIPGAVSITKQTPSHDLAALATNPKAMHTFSCSWLAPTAHPHLYQGQLHVLPDAALLFRGQRPGRTVQLHLQFVDILNISRGSWNGARGQALIMDLVRGRRRSWAFVGWPSDSFCEAERVIVNEWQRTLQKRIRSELDRRKAVLDAKHERIAGRQYTCPEPRMTISARAVAVKDQVMRLLSHLMSHSPAPHSPAAPSFLSLHASQPCAPLKHQLASHSLRHIPPMLLVDILTDRATGFMANLRSLQGAILVADRGWIGRERSFTILVTMSHLFGDGRDTDATREIHASKLSRWTVRQRLLVYTPDHAVFTNTFEAENDSERKGHCYTVMYEAVRDRSLLGCEEDDMGCLVTVTGQTDATRSTDPIRPAMHLEQQRQAIDTALTSYLRQVYLPPLFNLLGAMAQEAEFEFESDGSGAHPPRGGPPTTRYLPYMLRTNMNLLQMHLTVLLLPPLYLLTVCLRKRVRDISNSMTLALFILLAASLLLLPTMRQSARLSMTTARSAPLHQMATLLDAMASTIQETEAPLHALRLRVARRASSIPTESAEADEYAELA